MLKKFAKIWRREKGTALLVALLVMGVLIAISLALSTLILSEARSTKELIDAGRAYYAAESGIEEALYYLDTELPGWEGADVNIGEVGERAVFSYEVKNKCNAYPCFDEKEYALGAMYAHNFYDVLELNETITIPLFTVNQDSEVEPVRYFTVEFFTIFNPMTDLVFSEGISGWDVLRWKVFGLWQSNDDGSYHTEALHDFTAVSAARNSDDGSEFLTNAAVPSWFGTHSCSEGGIPEIEGNRITEKIVCQPYKSIAYASSEDEMEFTICTQQQSRDYYLYSGDEFISKQSCYPIDTFMDRHQVGTGGGGGTGLNYLSLTNLMNPSMLNSDNFDDVIAASDIYFRVETYDKDTVREFAQVISDGYSGDVKQSISVEIKRDSYMPVFNFSIYSTYGSDKGFYQGENKVKQDLPE
jgi:hypothetical protein